MRNEKQRAKSRKAPRVVGQPSAYVAEASRLDRQADALLMLGQHRRAELLSRIAAELRDAKAVQA